MPSLADRIAEWMKGQLEEAAAKGIALGLSGGIDSSVVAVLAQRATGGNVLGAIMPCDSSPEDAKHARLLADQFGIETITADLSIAFQALLAELPQGSALALANLKPRLRMTTIYYLANARGYLVAGTGNKTERLIGYFTKYGDGAVDLAPIGGLYKHEVRQLARELGVPNVIIEKPPSAGLWANQTDEGEIGISYDELDGILAALEDKRPTDQYDQAKVGKVKALVASSAHKRVLPPIFVPE